MNLVHVSLQINSLENQHVIKMRDELDNQHKHNTEIVYASDSTYPIRMCMHFINIDCILPSQP